jgi:hypothetical protein
MSTLWESEILCFGLLLLLYISAHATSFTTIAVVMFIVGQVVSK